MSENINLVVIVGEHQPHQERQKLLKLREGPKICRRKLNFDNYTKNVKKEGEGSKYVGEHQPHQERQQLLKLREGPKICRRKF